MSQLEMDGERRECSCGAVRETGAAKAEDCEFDITRTWGNIARPDDCVNRADPLRDPIPF